MRYGLRSMMRWCVLLVACLVPVTASAQVIWVPVTSSSFVDFDPSPDHNATVTQPDGSSTAVLTSYVVRFYPVDAAGNIPAGSAPLISRDIGKPTPNAQNKIVVANVLAMILPGVGYRVKVEAVGPAGGTLSTSMTSPFFSPSPIVAPRAWAANERIGGQ